MKKSIFAIAALAAVLAIAILHNKRLPEGRPIEPRQGTLSYDADIDFLAVEISAIGAQVPFLAPLAADTIRDCGMMKDLFKEAFVASPGVSFDFILRIHEDPFREKPVPKYPESKKLVKRVITGTPYDYVAFEGCCFDGFSPESRMRETYTRLAYADPHQLAPEALEMLRQGQLKSYESARPYLVRYFSQRPAGEMEELYEFERKNRASFIAGELPTLTTLLSHIYADRLSGNKIQDLAKSINRLRSAYAVAVVLKKLRDSKASYGAVVYGYLHDEDFKHISAKLGLRGRLVNATSYTWDEIARMR